MIFLQVLLFPSNLSFCIFSACRQQEAEHNVICISLLVSSCFFPLRPAKTLFGGKVEGNNAANVGVLAAEGARARGKSFAARLFWFALWAAFFFCRICIIFEHVIRGARARARVRVPVPVRVFPAKLVGWRDFCNHRHYQVAQSATSPSFKLNDDGGSGIHFLAPSSSSGQTLFEGYAETVKELGRADGRYG